MYAPVNLIIYNPDSHPPSRMQGLSTGLSTELFTAIFHKTLQAILSRLLANTSCSHCPVACPVPPHSPLPAVAISYYGNNRKFCEGLEMVNRVDVTGPGGGPGGVSCGGIFTVTCQIAIDTAVFLVGYWIGLLLIVVTCCYTHPILRILPNSHSNLAGLTGPIPSRIPQ